MPARSISLVACAALLLVPGCGGDDEDQAATSTAPTTVTATTETEAPRTETAEPQETAPMETAPSAVDPEDQEGGAGDETPARSLVRLTGKGGSIRPPVVRVPPFISIRVELRASDGRTYALRFGDKRMVAGPELASVSTTFPGLRPGEQLIGRPVVGGNRVRVVASAEPGP